MCGIQISSNKSELLLKHRGIESNTFNFEGFSFTHFRLPISTEIGDKFKQPLDTKDYMILYNGEIFEELYWVENDVDYINSILPQIFRNSVDYNSLINLLSADGFFSIVFLDKKRKLIYFFTDLLGKKQLYYQIYPFGIASELKPFISKDLDKKYFSTIIKWGYNIDDSTPFNNVKRVMPGILYCYNMSTRRLLQERVLFPSKFYSDGFLYESLKDSISDSVKRRFYKNAAVLVSGGLDSSIIAYELENVDFDSKLTYYSIENDESEYVNVLEDFLKIKIHRLKLEYNEKMLDDIFYANDCPVNLGSVVPQYLLFNAIHKQNNAIKVVFSGDGADELFGGYSRIHNYDSQQSDIFDELTFYHLPRLDRLSMYFTLELRCPFLSNDIIRSALYTDLCKRTDKKILKDIYRGILPDKILDRPKKALKEPIYNTGDIYKVRLENISNYLKAIGGGHLQV